MDIGRITITAEDVDVKIANRLLLYIRNWEYGEDPTWDEYRIFLTVWDLDNTELKAEGPPLQRFHNEFQGMTFEAVEALMMSKNINLFLVLDNDGVQNQTIILFHRAIAHDENKIYYDEYNKMRIPWQEVTPVHVNISIGNMDFEEFTEENDTEDVLDSGAPDPNVARARGRWWTHNQIGSEFPDELVVRRDAAIKELAKLDLA